MGGILAALPASVQPAAVTARILDHVTAGHVQAAREEIFEAEQLIGDLEGPVQPFVPDPDRPSLLYQEVVHAWRAVTRAALPAATVRALLDPDSYSLDAAEEDEWHRPPRLLTEGTLGVEAPEHLARLLEHPLVDVVVAALTRYAGEHTPDSSMDRPAGRSVRELIQEAHRREPDQASRAPDRTRPPGPTLDDLDPARLRQWVDALTHSGVLLHVLAAMPRHAVDVGSWLAALQGMGPLEGRGAGDESGLWSVACGRSGREWRGPRSPQVAGHLAEMPELGPDDVLCALARRSDLTSAERAQMLALGGMGVLLRLLPVPGDPGGVLEAQVRRMAGAAPTYDRRTSLASPLFYLLARDPVVPRATMAGLLGSVAHAVSPELLSVLCADPEVVGRLDPGATATLLATIPRGARLELLATRARARGAGPGSAGAGSAGPGSEPVPEAAGRAGARRTPKH